VPQPRPLSVRPALAVLAVFLAGLLGAPLAVRAETGLPLPRFVSLRSAEVNLRTGPGSTYPVDWVYLRRHMPVEVIAEFDNWRKIRDWQGTVGWVHQNLLDGRRYARIAGADRTLLARPAADSPPVALLRQGVVAELLECEPQWCRLEAGGYRGWLPREAFWGAYPHETFD
jgi:SH3-like domain-containing protein